MKLKNIKKGDLLYLKTYKEVQESKYFSRLDSTSDVGFTDDSLFYSKNGEGRFGGQLVTVVDVDSDDVCIHYNTKLGTKGYVSRHAFRKPTSIELEEYHGGKR